MSVAASFKRAEIKAPAGDVKSVLDRFLAALSSSSAVMPGIAICLSVSVLGCAPRSLQNSSLGDDQASLIESNATEIVATEIAAEDSITKDLLAADDMVALSGSRSLSEYLSEKAATTRTIATNDKNLIKLFNQPGTSRLLVQTGDDVPAFNVTTLSNPTRLVLDITNMPGQTNSVATIDDSQFISRVRLGAHQDKERIVLDMIAPNAAVPAHQVDVVDGALLLTLSDNIVLAQNEIGEFAANRNALASNDALDLMAQPKDVLNSEVAAELPTELPKIEVAATDEDITPHVRTIKIEQTGPASNRVIADVTSAGVFKLERTAPSEYVLRVEAAQIEPEAIRPQIASADSGVIRSARAVQAGNDVLIRIFAQPNAELVATAASGKLIVAQNNNQMAVAPIVDAEPLAQLADEKKAESDTITAQDVEVKDGEDVANTASSTESEISSFLEGEQKYTGRLISLDLQDTDIDNALRIIAEVSNLNIIASDDVTGKVTLRLIDVPWDQALDVILKTNGLDKVQELNVIRVAPVEKLRTEREALKEAQRADEELQALLVRYVRVSYAKASEIKPLVETVITERGSVAVDERSNQLIVKDIQKGITNVAELIRKLDLRTPQVLLETQIVEAQRNFARDLGIELGFEYVQSPETGNATGHNFPNSISVGGSVNPDSNVGVLFPAALEETAGSAVSFLFGSADGSQSLGARLTSFEQEGRIRVVSRPSVATINNKKATIKSVEKIRVRTPDSGLSVATGQGAVASGGSATATETFEVGITLDVTPQASPDFYVLLDIHAKSSTLGANEVDGIPSEVERSATSTVLVSSGQTFALGGIYKILDNETLSGVPFLKDVPFLGSLFRRNAIESGDEELIFFITPRIVEGSFDDAAMKLNS
jgi:type IV pilus assembly protein PilQ